MKIKTNNIFWCLAAVAASLWAASCASMGTPSGGPRDERPPRMVRANPAPGSTGVTHDRIVIDFDEIVNVKDAFTKVVVSPPTKSVPRVASQGRRVTVDFQDSLLPNTTYTIDFANTIEDNNEGNKLQGFTYTFSTGPSIDSLRVSGMVISARESEPQQGMVVAIYSNLADSAFSTLRPDRLAKTDDRGRFTIRGLAPGSYRLFAVADLDNDYHHANPEEDMAFYEFTVSPSTEYTTVTDTIWDLRAGRIDTVVERQTVRYLPNDILMRSYQTEIKPQFLAKYERPDSARLSLIFNARSKTPPAVALVDHPELKDWYTLERSADNDTLTYWLRPDIAALDTLLVATTYLRPDSTQKLVEGTDTLRFTTFRLPGAAKKEKKEKKKIDPEVARADSLRKLALPFRFGSSSQDVYLPLSLDFESPLASLDTTAFHMEMKTDTVWGPAPYPIHISRADTLSPRRYIIEYPWEYGTEYRLTADTIAATDIYGRVTPPMKQEIKVKSESDYCSLTFNISDWPSDLPGFVELLNTSDIPVRRVPLTGNTVFFPYLSPGKYYARIFEDFNGNGVYDTGNLELNRQPEPSYYYPKAINIKKNWDKSEPWEVWSTAVDLMKPATLLKNKPETDKRSRQNNRNTQEEEEEEEIFDPTRNPFDPNDRGRRNR